MSTLYYSVIASGGLCNNLYILFIYILMEIPMFSGHVRTQLKTWASGRDQVHDLHIDRRKHRASLPSARCLALDKASDTLAKARILVVAPPINFCYRSC